MTAPAPTLEAALDPEDICWADSDISISNKEIQVCEFETLKKMSHSCQTLKSNSLQDLQFSTLHFLHSSGSKNLLIKENFQKQRLTC